MARHDVYDDRNSQAAAPDPLTTFGEHRCLLLSIAYRMTGSIADAEDVLQDAFIRWQHAPRDDIRSPKAFLVTIVSRLCINHLQSARVQREEYVGQWLPEPVVTDAASDPTSAIWAGESISMAFLVLLERPNPIERSQPQISGLEPMLAHPSHSADAHRRTGELAGSGPADADLRSGASETGFSACSRRRQPARGEMPFPARCGSAWPQP